MAREQPSAGDLLHLLESTDLHRLGQIKALISEQLSTERGSVLLNGLVDYYLETSSSQAIQILTSVREPHDKHLLDKLNECMAKPACRLPTLTLLGHIVRKQPSWIHKLARSPLLLSLLRCLKADSDPVVLVTGVLVLIALLPMIPQAGKHHLYEFFDIFGRLASWNLRNPGHVTEVYLIHLHASVYSLFHRLYGMYPCNFVSYLRAHYSMKENMDTFEQVVKPMLEHVRIHPELVTGTKDQELEPTRWKRFEIHDIVIECAKVSLDPKEASCEGGYCTAPDRFSTRLQLRPPASPHPDVQDSYGSSTSTPRQALPPHCSPHTSQHQILSCDVTSCCTTDPIWSPSSVCGMATPPSSRGISPTNALELSQSASHFLGRVHSTSAGGKGAAPSPHPTLADEFTHASLPPPSTASPPRKNRRPTEFSKPSQVRQEPIRELERGRKTEANSRDGACESVTMTMMELSDLTWEQEQRAEEEQEEALVDELLKITEDERYAPGLRGFDSPFYRTTETLTGAQEKPPPPPRAPNPASDPPAHPASVFTPIDRPVWSPSHAPNTEEEGDAPIPPRPYETLFDRPLPQAASLFVGRRTEEGGRGLEEEDGQGEGLATTSPLEVLDRLIQQGGDVHHKVLKRLPLPSKSADWTHFGGSAPSEELRSQLLLLHNQLLFERYKREQHAVRNRRLLRRIINATALEEQNHAMKDQMSLQTVDVLSLRESLQVEQHRYRQLWDDRETVVTLLHSQIRQLQQGRDQYYTRTQELQTKLQECQKRMGEMEAELQRANNKVCNTGHQLNQLSVKLSTSETAQQQTAFLNKQLLLMGEVNRLCVEELQHCSQDTSKEVQMLRTSSLKEAEKLQQSVVQQAQGLEAALQRVGDLEAQLSRKEHVAVEQKRFLEDVKSQARAELQASESRYQVQRQMTQALQTELLQAPGVSVSPGGATEPCRPHRTRPAGGSVSTPAGQVNVQNDVDGGLSDSQSSDSSTLLPGKPQVDPTPRSINGSRDHAPPSRRLPLSPPPSWPDDAPLPVGSCPSAKSFLGMQARELFHKKKSESRSRHGGEERRGMDAPPPGGHQGRKSERFVEPAGGAGPGPPAKGPAQPAKGPTRPPTAKEARPDAQQRANDRGRGGAGGGASHARQRQQPHPQRLRIMDYNETHQGSGTEGGTEGEREGEREREREEKMMF